MALYRDGKGIPRNPAEELKWTRRVADKGYADAQSERDIWRGCRWVAFSAAESWSLIPETRANRFALKGTESLSSLTAPTHRGAIRYALQTTSDPGRAYSATPADRGPTRSSRFFGVWLKNTSAELLYDVLVVSW